MQSQTISRGQQPDAPKDEPSLQGSAQGVDAVSGTGLTLASPEDRPVPKGGCCPLSYPRGFDQAIILCELWGLKRGAVGGTLVKVDTAGVT